jgi:hypothetical protein
MKAKAQELNLEDSAPRTLPLSATAEPPVGLVQKVAGSRITGTLINGGVNKVRLGTVLRVPCGPSAVFGVVSNKG